MRRWGMKDGLGVCERGPRDGNGCLRSVGTFTIPRTASLSISTRIHEVDFDGLRLDDHAIELALDQIAVVRVGRLVVITTDSKTLTKSFHHKTFDLWCGYAGHAARLVGSLLQDRMRNVVAIARAVLVRVRRGHPVATVVENAARENCWRTSDT